MSFSGQTTNEIESGEITNNGFFPSVSLNTFVSEYAIPQTSVDTVRTHLANSIIDVNDKLKLWQVEREKEGHNTLGDIACDVIGNISALETLYFRAVFCQAKAFILRDYPTIDRREPAENQAKSSVENQIFYEKWSIEAINKIIGEDDILVGLI